MTRNGSLSSTDGGAWSNWHSYQKLLSNPRSIHLAQLPQSHRQPLTEQHSTLIPIRYLKTTQIVQMYPPNRLSPVFFLTICRFSPTLSLHAVFVGPPYLSGQTALLFLRESADT